MPSFFEQDWDRQNGTQIVTEMCGFVTILSGTFLLHRTKDMVEGAFLNFIYGAYLRFFFIPSWKTRFSDWQELDCVCIQSEKIVCGYEKKPYSYSLFKYKEQEYAYYMYIDLCTHS